jgi:hypothetical protein
MRIWIGRWDRVIAALVAVLVLLSVASAAGVSIAEENDSFCATCHLNPERTYVERARGVAQAVDQAQTQGLTGDEIWRRGRDAAHDLASAHRAAEWNCVSCHRGRNDLSDRATALMLGASNSLRYLVGDFDADHKGVAQPGLVEASCLRCHVKAPQLGGLDDGEVNPVMVDSFENHFHIYLFEPSYADQVTIGCLDCHPSHLAMPAVIPYFTAEEQAVLPACVQCHIDVRKGPLDL